MVPYAKTAPRPSIRPSSAPVTNDARTVTGFLSIAGLVLIGLAAALLHSGLEDGDATRTAWAVLLLALGTLGAGVGAVVLGVTLTDSRDDARR